MAKLTAEQVEELAELRERGWQLSRLAQRYGVSIGAVKYRCLVLGAAAPNERPPAGLEQPAVRQAFGRPVRLWTKDEDARLLDLARAGRKLDTIAVELGRPRTSTRIRYLQLELAEGAA